MPVSLPRGVLLLPDPKHRRKLLAVGSCGSRPPTARLEGKLWHPNSGTIDPDADALALAWEDQVLHAGCFTARWSQYAETWRLTSRALKGHLGALRELCQHLDSGTLITVGVRRGELNRYRPLEVVR